MSDFLIVLVLMGVAVVLAVVVFNWWQEKKYRRRVELHFRQTRRDVLVDDFQIDAGLLKQEKSLLAESSVVAEVGEDDYLTGADLLGEVVVRQAHEYTQEKSESKFEKTTSKRSRGQKMQDSPSLFAEEALPESTSVNTETTNFQTDEINDLPMLHGHTDLEYAEEHPTDVLVDAKPAVAEVKLATEDPLQPPMLHMQMDLYAILHHRTGLNIQALLPLIAELNTFTQNTFGLGFDSKQRWLNLKPLNADDPQLFTHIACSIQLADRGGALDRSTIYRFQHTIETLGLSLGCHVEWQGGHDAVQQAQLVDQFCLDVDKAVEFHLLSNTGAFHATKLRGLAEANGLKLESDGRFYMTNIEDHSEFSIRNFEGKAFSADMLKTAVMTGVTFQLDIPTVKNNTDVFDRMIAIANNMSQSLDAVMIDVNRKPIGELQIEKIRQQLKVINATMIAKGITPGSQHALRLFS